MRLRGMSSPHVWTALAIFAIAPSASAQTINYTTNAEFSAGQFSNAVDNNPANQIVLGPSEVSKTSLLWVDNYYPGWIVRIDTKTGRQTARFDSALTTINGISTGARPSREVCDWASKGNCPGRVAVDGNGDVWIVNRAFGAQGTLSKFSGNIGHCIDRNNNGVIDTSSDVNGDGIIDPTNPNEYLEQRDECILTTIPIGGVNHLPRGVAVDKKGKIWVATHNGQMVYRFNPNEPVNLEASVSVSGKAPYSMAAGGDYVFISNSNAGPTRIHIDTMAVQHATGANCAGTYGVVADPGGWTDTNGQVTTGGNVAWFGGYFTGNGILRVDWSSGTGVCQRINTPSTNITAVTLDLQDPPQVWGSGYSGNQLCRFSMAGALLACYSAGSVSSPHGLSVDFQGAIYQVSDAGPIVKFNPATGALVSTINIGAASSAYSYTPYLYSDFTGVQIHRQAPYGRLGSWSVRYDGQAGAIPWRRVRWNTEPQGTVPAETRLNVSARAADSLTSLGTSAYSALTNNAVISDIKGRYVEVKVDMAGPGYRTPALSDLAIQGPCDVLGKTCCLKASDCDDGNACTEDLCPVPGGACTYKPVANCCQTNADCNDKNACTVDACPGPGQQCTHSAVAGCCQSNSDCNDNNPCSTDICSGPGGTCQNPLINGCCLTDLDCTKGNPCSAAKCPSPGQLCVGGFVPGCCTDNTGCADNDLCTTDICDTSVNTCANAKIDGCCNLDQECFDTNICTQDRCSGPGGQCIFPSIPTCCTDESPELGQPCDIPVSPNDFPPCQAGKLVCTANKFVCEGAITPVAEVCDGIDNDCNGSIDTPNPCPGDQVCIYGYCASPCGAGEFPCGTGFQCTDGLCVPTSCDNLHCPAGTECLNGACIPTDGGVGGSGGGAGSTGSSGASGMSNDDGGTPVTDAAIDGSSDDASGGASGNSQGQGGEAGQFWGQTTGGGGCKCDIQSGGRHRSTALTLAGLAFAFAMIRRRRSGGDR